MASVDFDLIRKSVTVEDVLPWLGLDLKPTKDQLRGPCPLNDGGHRALVVTPALNTWYCWAPTCRFGGGVIELVMKIKKLEQREAALEIQRHFTAAKPPAPEGLHKVAEYLDPVHDAVQALGLSAVDATRLGIGYAPKGVLKGRVLLPIRTSEGTLVGYAGYSDKLQPALKLPSKLF